LPYGVYLSIPNFGIPNSQLFNSLRLGSWALRIWELTRRGHSAPAPDTTSMISLVIAAWRTLFM
jgi:hypothetical protein